MPKIKIEFACDGNGNHRAPIYKCTESQLALFTNAKAALAFINECSYVYNLHELYYLMPKGVIEIADNVIETTEILIKSNN